MANGPGVWLAVAVMAWILGAPIVLGTIIGHVLMARGNRWWLLVPRNLVGWTMLVASLIVIPAAISGGQFNGREFSELSLGTRALILGVFPAIAFLTLRRWKRTSPVGSDLSQSQDDHSPGS